MTLRFCGRILALTLCLWFGLSAAAERFYYLGSVGGQPVQMDLTLSGTSAQGHYYYDAIGAPLDLEGMITLGGEVRSIRKPSPPSGGNGRGVLKARCQPA